MCVMEYGEWLNMMSVKLDNRYKIDRIVSDENSKTIEFSNGFTYTVQKYELMYLWEQNDITQLYKDIEREYLKEIMK